MPLIPFLELPSLPESSAAGGSQGAMRTTGGRLNVHNGQAWKAYAFTDETVALAGDQTIGGVKTFTSAPAVPDGSFSVAKIGASGTRDATTYLRGDGTWSAPPVAAAPANMVTTDTVQSISGNKTFTGTVNAATLQRGGVAVVTTDDARLSDARTPTTHVHAGGDITTGTVPAARLGSGTPGVGNFLRGDGSWQGVVTGLVAGTGIQISSATGNVTITATGAAAPTNMVTTDTTQTISGTKTFSATLTGTTINATTALTQNDTAVVLEDDARLTNARTPTAHNHAAGDITSGVLSTARLGTGAPTTDTFLRGDGTWATPPADSGIPANMATTDTTQNISGVKTFTVPQNIMPTTTAGGPTFASGAATNSGGGSGTYTGALLVQPTGAVNSQIGLLIRAPSASWGTGAIGYSEGQAILYVSETNDVRFRVDRNGNTGIAGGLHVSPGANGSPTTGSTQAVWIQPLAAMVPLVADTNLGNNTSDVALFRSDGGNDIQMRVKGNYGTEFGPTGQTTIYGDAASGYIMYNCYYDGTNWRFKGTGSAQLMSLGSAYLATYQSSVSGTAGGIITWIGSFAASNINYSVPTGRIKVTNNPTTPASVVIANQEAEVFTYQNRMYTKGYQDVPVSIDAVRSYIVGANTTTTGTTQLAVITSPTMPAGQYTFEIIGAYTGTTTAQGLRVSVQTAATSFFIINLMHAGTNANTFVAATGITNGGAIGTATASLTAGQPFQCWGQATTTAAGTISFRAASSTTGGITILQGTLMRITRIA
jgi:hypothetical protein